MFDTDRACDLGDRRAGVHDMGEQEEVMDETMSYGAELLSDLEVEESVFFGIAEARLNQGLWTTRDGAQIRVKDMSRRHIENTIAMLKRGNSIFKQSWIEVFENELKNRDYIRKCANEGW